MQQNVPTDPQKLDDDFSLTLEQFAFVTNAWNAIERAFAEDDQQFFNELTASEAYQRLFGKMSIDQVVDRYELMTTQDPREAFEQYITELFAPEDEVLQAIYASPAENDMPMISVTPADGYLLQWLLRLINAKTAVEIGALAGYSGTWIARALPEDGKLYCVEKSSKHAAVARANFERAGVSSRVQVMEGSSEDLLPKLAQHAPFDFVFIDADKVSYPRYLEWAVENLRAGGIVAAHNAYRHGKITAPESDDDRAMDVFNRALAAHPQLSSMIIPLGDAMAVGVKQ